MTRHDNKGSVAIVAGSTTRDEAYAHLHLGIGPAGDLDDHVEDRLLLVGVQGDIVEGRDGDAILLDVYPVLEGVGRALLADLVLGRHIVVCACAAQVSCCSGEVPGNLCSSPGRSRGWR